MRTKPHPEQGFRSCLGILRMEKTYGAQRLEAACRCPTDPEDKTSNRQGSAANAAAH
jgi:hypothetical protein